MHSRVRLSFLMRYNYRFYGFAIQVRLRRFWSLQLITINQKTLSFVLMHGVLDPFAVADVTGLGKRPESRSPTPFVTGESIGFRFNEWGFQRLKYPYICCGTVVRQPENHPRNKNFSKSLGVHRGPLSAVVLPQI